MTPSRLAKAFLLLTSFAAALSAADLRITTNSLPPGTVAQPYSQTLTATGARAPYAWSISSGNLPSGLSLSGGGIISGSPTTAGTFNFTARAFSATADAGDDDIDTQALSIVVAAALNISTSSFPGGQVGVAYSQALQAASGGTTPYTWSISAGSLPQSLSLSGSQISGTPTTFGTANFTVRVVDKNSATVTRALSIAIAPAPVSITTSSLPGGQVGVSYSQTLQASGGTGGFTWSISAGSLPAGLSLGSSGVISGTPTASGTANFTVRANDSTSGSATRALSIVVSPPAVTITTASLPNGQVGVAYSQSVQASGGTGSYTWSISAGSLPAGLSLGSSGQISGTPTASGTANFTVRANDTASGSATKALSILIAPAALTITTTSLPSGQAGIPYSQTLQASGGTAPFTWSIASGSLPPGLSLSSAGQISGTPSAASNTTFSARVSDSSGTSTTASLSISIAAALSLGSCPSANGVVSQAYTATLSASGGTPPYSWTISSGQLPTGLTLSAASGQISGTPSAAGTFNFGVRVSDQKSATATSTCSITVSTPTPQLTISTASLPDGISGVPYSQTLSGSGGQQSYTWTVASGSLPPGLSLSAGRVQGTPTTPGTFPFTLRLTDGSGTSVTKAFSIRIGNGLTLVTSSLGSVKTGVASTQQLSASGGLPPYLWTLVGGALPPGLALSSTGSISGTPTAPGSYGFTIRVTDSAAGTAERSFTIVSSASLGINFCPASTATQGQSYTSTASASGGQTPYTWTVASGALPAGLLFNSASGAVNGVPSDAGSYAFTLLITDSAGATATKECQLVVGSSLAVTTLALPDASPNSQYFQSLSAAGGKAPYSWTLFSGSLPSGLTLNTAGVISGLAVQVGSFSFTVNVTDLNGTAANRTLSINVIAGLNVTGCPATLGEAGLLFNSQLLGTGGTPPYSWAVSGGTLPAGLTLDALSGVIAGTPSEPGTIPFVVNARDTLGQTANRSCSIEIRAPVTISTSGFSPAASGAPFAEAIATAGGIPPFVWSTTAGSLPPGLSLNPGNGQITGTPLIAGTFAFTAKVIDGIGGQATKDLSIAITQGLTIPDCPTPAGLVGQSYAALLTAAGGTLPYRWTIDSGALPPGLLFSPANAAITGTPLQPGSAAYVLKVEDANSKTTTRFCSIQINPAGLTITSSAALPNGLAGEPYSQTLTATGGRTAYSWSITTAGAPNGFSLSSTGALTGVPVTAGTFSFTVQVTDQDNNVARQLVTLVILAGTPPNISIMGLPDIIDPGQQPSFSLKLDSDYPAPINGTVTLVFSPDPAVGIDDPAVRFATGGRELKFTVPAHSTQASWSAPVVAFQSGTVSGTIQLNLKLESNGTDITPPDSSRTLRVDRVAPRIASVRVTKVASGFEVRVTGFATTREVTQGTFRFSGDAAGSVVEVTVPLDGTSKTWFQSAASGGFGGQFGMVQSFQWQGEPTVTLNSVSVTLMNAQGTSAAVQARF